MKTLPIFLLLGTVMLTGGCAGVGEWLSAEPAKSESGTDSSSKGYNTQSMADLMSSENVMVYPLDGPIDPKRLTFPEYDNPLDTKTTAAGYTVFDPSVEVYSGGEIYEDRPEYLPEYSVPKYHPLPKKKVVEEDVNIVDGAMVTDGEAVGLPRPVGPILTSVDPVYDETPPSDSAPRYTPVLTSY